MVTAKKQIQTTYVLSLSEEEARFLLRILQNPYNRCALNEDEYECNLLNIEDESITRVREKLFRSLKNEIDD